MIIVCIENISQSHELESKETSDTVITSGCESIVQLGIAILRARYGGFRRNTFRYIDTA